MKAIIDGKLYDTKKAKNILTWRRSDFKCLLNLYKTAKDNYFTTEEYRLYAEMNLKVLPASEAKCLLMRLDVDKYIELFGEVEEA